MAKILDMFKRDMMESPPPPVYRYEMHSNRNNETL